MKNRVGLIVAVLGLLIAVSVVVIVVTPRRDPSVIKIGAVLPLSGEIAEYGKRCQAGINLAIEEINAVGGIDGKKLEVIYEDSAGAPKTGVAAAIKLIAVDGTKVIIGGVASSVTLAIEPIATSKGVILFSPASSSPRLTGISKYFFRTWPSDVFEATAIAEFSYRTLRLRRVAVLYVNNDYGLGLKDEFTKRFKACGGQVVEIQTHEQGTNDLRTQLTKIKSASPDGVYLAGYHREMAFATKQMRELGVTAQILGDADYGVQELLDIAGNSAEGAIYSTPEYNINTGTDSVRAFADAFKRKYGRESSVFEANAYDAVMIVSKAIEKHGLDTEQIADFIASVENYAGASGDISFGAKGEVEKPASIKIVKGGAFHLY